MDGPAEIHRSASGGAPGELPAAVTQLSGGDPLDAGVRTEMEAAFGRDFGDVRVHDTSGAAVAAASINAHAYTLGNDVVFGAGRYDVHSDAGKHLLAHELTHVVQQGGAGEVVQRDPGGGTSHASAELERLIGVVEAAFDAARGASEQDQPPPTDGISDAIAELRGVLAGDDEDAKRAALAELATQLSAMGLSPMALLDSGGAKPTAISEKRSPSVAAKAIGISSPGDAAEVEAERVADAVVAGRPVTVAAAATSAIHRSSKLKTALYVAGAVGVGIAGLVWWYCSGKRSEATPWDHAKQQEDDLAALADDSANQATRDRLIDEIGRQVPDLQLVDAVGAGADAVITIVLPGGGLTGIKTLNDKLVGYAINAGQIIPARNTLINETFSDAFSIVDQNYKSTTMVPRGDEDLAGTLREGMAAIDNGMRGILVDGLDAGRAFWAGQRTPEAGTRVAAIAQTRGLVDRDDFAFDMQVGCAGVEGEGSAAAIGAKMNATKAAIMGRDREENNRLTGFNEEDFVEFCKEGHRLAKALADQTITVGEHAVPLFLRAEVGFIPNPDVLRDVRKGKITTQTVDEDEVERVEQFLSYIDHINAFDYFKGYKGDEMEAVDDGIASARAAVEALRDGAGDADTVRAVLHTAVQGGPLVAEQGTASEAMFFNRTRDVDDRIIFNMDIIDLGLDGMLGYSDTMHRVATSDDPGAMLDDASLSANNGLIDFKRQAFGQVRVEYQRFLRRLIDDAIHEALFDSTDPLVVALEAEMEPLMLLGGDELTISVHAAFRPLVPEMVARFAEVSRSRVAITEARNGAWTGKQAKNAASHQRAMQDGDPAAGELKTYEVLHRKLVSHLARIPHDLHGAAKVIIEDCQLSQLYADTRDGGFRLKVRGTGEDIDDATLRERFDAATLELTEMEEH